MSGIITLARSGACLSSSGIAGCRRDQPLDDGLVEVRGQIRVDEHHTCHARIARDERGHESPVGVRHEHDRLCRTQDVEHSHQRRSLVADSVFTFG